MNVVFSSRPRHTVIVGSTVSSTPTYEWYGRTDWRREGLRPGTRNEMRPTVYYRTVQ